MILTVDIGNTNVVVGGFAGEEPSFVDRLPSSREWDGTAWREALGKLLRERGLTADKIAGSALCSVVPELTERLRSALREVTRRPVRTVDAELDVGLVLAGYDRRTLGNDRVVDAVSALARYAPPLAVFDLGTATTLSVLDREGAFLGGMILPGLGLSVEALAARASQLPPIPLEAPATLLGTDAVSCMQSGAIYGAAAQIDGLTARVEELLGQPVTAVGTGGLSGLVCPYCRRAVFRDEHLLLRGLHLIYRGIRGSAAGQT